MLRTVDAARADRRIITVPSVVLAEWWRDDFGKRADMILRACVIEPVTESLSKRAGAAACWVGASAVDAVVMASAASRGDVVYTSDLLDLQALQQVFPSVRLFRA